MAILSVEFIRARKSAPSRLLLELAAIAAIAALGSAKGAGSPERVDCTIGAGPGKVTCSARTFSMDYKTHLMHMNGDVKVARGDLSVAADEAQASSSSQDFKNSHWVFTGNVHVRTESQGDLHADRATVEITNGALGSADVSGSPAQFEQTRVTSGRLVKGHAATIHYDVAAATVKLTGDAMLNDVRNDNDGVHGQNIAYNIREQRIVADSSGVPGGRVNMTVTPKKEPPKAAHDSSATPGKP
jgi:lipopolysaccharide export system protein LptA